MSDDIPIIFAQGLCAPAAGGKPVAAFLSAASLPQMQQYAAGDWTVQAAPGFRSPAAIDLKAVPAETAPADAPTLISCELAALDAASADTIKAKAPPAVKINGAFQEAEAGKAEMAARMLADLGYTVLGAHWRNDNSFGIRILSHIDHLKSFEPPEWNRLNLIGLKDAAMAKTILAFGKLYTGEERRIGELRVAKAIRDDHIAALEKALMAHQQSAIKSPRS